MATITANPTRNPPQTPPATTIRRLQQPTANHRSLSKPTNNKPTTTHRRTQILKPTKPTVLVLLRESQTHKSSSPPPPPSADPVERNTQRRDRPNPGPRVGSRSGPCTKRPGGYLPKSYRGGWGGSGWLGWLEVAGQRAEAESREQRQREEAEKENIAKPHACFGRKMVYGKFFRKPFSVFYKAIFRSKEKNFRWLSILPRSKHPAWLKTFSVKRFQSIQTEPRCTKTNNTPPPPPPQLLGYPNLAI
jgi:hypothetical protein